MDIDNKLPVLDSELLNGYLQTMGKDVVKQMFTLYCQQSELYLQDIETALSKNSAQLWQEHCHKMKGAASSVGLKALYERLVIMEKSTEDATKKAQQLAELKVHNQQSIADFSYWLEEQ